MALCLIVQQAVAAHGQMSNGDFENNPQPGYPVVTAPAYVDPGTNTWRVASGTINVGTGPAGTTCQAGPASHCIDLNGDSPGRIEQALTGISAGDRCTVRFYLSRHKNLATATATLYASVNSLPTASDTFVHSVAGVGVNNGMWQLRSFTFTATSSTNVLSFHSQMSGAAGPQVDNVTITCQGGGVIDAAGPLTEIMAEVPYRIPVQDPCCPPWNAGTLANRLAYQSAGAIGGAYTLRFTSTQALDGQLSAYVGYLHTMDAAITSIRIDFALHDAGTGAAPAAGAQVGATSTVTWGPTSGPVPPPTFFAPGVMQVNRWYTVRTRIYLNDGITFFPDTCSNVETSVRIQTRGAVAGRGEGAVIQVRGADGRIVERPLTPAPRR